MPLKHPDTVIFPYGAGKDTNPPNNVEGRNTLKPFVKFCVLEF